MSEIMSESENFFVWNNCLSSQSLKRGLNSDECFEKRDKRFRDNQHMEWESTRSHYYTNRSNGDNRCPHVEEEEEEEWRELTEFDRMLMTVSNNLLNFSLNFVEAEDDWSQEYVVKADTNEGKGSQHKKSIGFPPKVGHKMFGYCLDRLVSSDKRLALFLGHKAKQSDKQLIIRIGIESGFVCLQNEYNNYNKLRNVGSVVQVLDHIWWRAYTEKLLPIRWAFSVYENFGPNLVDVMRLSINGCFVSPMERVFDYAIQMIDIIENIHERGLIHCAIKPQNFVLQNHCNSSVLKVNGLTDAKCYICTKSDGTLGHIEDQKDRKFYSPKGDPNFHSIGYHNGFSRSRRDDMESLGYCIVFIARGGLPWIDSKTWTESRVSFSAKLVAQIGKRMQTTSLEELCFGLPKNFVDYFEIISHYKFTQRPNYEELRQCFRH